MKVIFFGATGKLGLLVVNKLLAKNHEVTAFARLPEKVTIQHPSLKIVKGDVNDEGAVGSAINGHEAVINAVGGEYGPEANVRVSAVTHIIEGMRQAGVRRIINMGGLGILQIAGLSVYRLPIFPKEMAPVTLEHKRVFQALQHSGLDWTVVCPPNMTPEPATGKYLTKTNSPFLNGKKEIPLEDVADFIARELDQRQYIGKRVAIAVQ